MSDEEFIWPFFDEKVFGDDNERYTWDATYWNREPHLAESFKDAGDAIIESFIRSQGRYRSLFYPALYCYRHHLELMIKYITNGVSEYFSLGEKHGTGHDLKQLWNEMESILIEVVGDRLFPSDEEHDTFQRAKTRIMEFHDRDPRNERFRYSRTKKNQTIDDELSVAPQHLRRVVSETSAYLYALYDYCTNGEG